MVVNNVNNNDNDNHYFFQFSQKSKNFQNQNFSFWKLLDFGEKLKKLIIVFTINDNINNSLIF